MPASPVTSVSLWVLVSSTIKERVWRCHSSGPRGSGRTGPDAGVLDAAGWSGSWWVQCLLCQERCTYSRLPGWQSIQIVKHSSVYQEKPQKTLGLGSDSNLKAIFAVLVKTFSNNNF